VQCRFRRAAVLILFVVIALFFPLLAPPPHRIDEEHFALIRKGMTEAEVEAIFGVPEGSYNWAVGDPEFSLWMDVLVELEYVQQQAVIVLNEREFNREFSRKTRQWFTPWASWVMQRGDVRNVKTWISRHGSFYVATNSNGLVVSKGQMGKPRIEPPWQRWWRRFTAK
jgi:hypothetical protein